MSQEIATSEQSTVEGMISILAGGPGAIIMTTISDQEGSGGQISPTGEAWICHAQTLSYLEVVHT